MPASVRWVLGIALCSVLVVGLTIGAGVTSVYQSGMISVSVQPRGGGAIGVAIPAATANLALAAIHWLPRDSSHLTHSQRELWESLDTLLPAAQEALDRLADQPDFTVVEFSSRSEKVVVRKIGRKLRIEVDVDGTRVDVSVPLRTVREFARRILDLSEEF